MCHHGETSNPPAPFSPWPASEPPSPHFTMGGLPPSSPWAASERPPPLHHHEPATPTSPWAASEPPTQPRRVNAANDSIPLPPKSFARIRGRSTNRPSVHAKKLFAPQTRRYWVAGSEA